MIRLLAGDCRDVLATLPSESVQCVVCSPPYYGLRDYGTALWDGGDATCEHTQGRSRNDGSNGRHNSAVFHGSMSTEHGGGTAHYRDTCSKCGAVRVDRQIGLEATPDEYLATMVGVFREVRRVLRRDGTCWVNMGDAFASSANGRSAADTKALGNDDRTFRDKPFGTVGNGYKPKDLMLMPARLALALQADGWWVRSDIIWHKPNPMPESVTDRPTSSHEHVFLLTRSARYFYDADAVREAHEEPWRSTGRLEQLGTRVPDDDMARGSFLGRRAREYNPAGRNLRNVWTIATSPYPNAHFATFPPELAERCIKAGTSERGCCAACGKPWQRTTERVSTGRSIAGPKSQAKRDAGLVTAFSGYDDGSIAPEFRTTGWAPGCQCDAPTQPCTVLDPFIGAGTTALVADRLQRDVIGIDLNTQYTRMAMDRCIADAPLFTSFPPAEDPEEFRMRDLFAGDEYERPAAVPERKPFRTGAVYVHQGPQPSNGMPDMAAD